MNSQLKAEIKQAGLFQYQIADALGISEQTLIRWLRYELPQDKLERVRAAIATLRTEGEQE